MSCTKPDEDGDEGDALPSGEELQVSPTASWVKQSSSGGRLIPRDKMEMPLVFHPTENMLLKEEVKVDIISKERE